MPGTTAMAAFDIVNCRLNAFEMYMYMLHCWGSVAFLAPSLQTFSFSSKLKSIFRDSINALDRYKYGTQVCFICGYIEPVPVA